MKKAIAINGILSIFLCGSFFFKCFGQQENDIHQAFRPHHQFGLMLGHTHVFEGINESGEKEILSLPSWGLDYTYNFHPKWAIGLHTDFIIEKYKVEKKYGNSDESETIERSYPIAPAIMGIYKLNEHWSFLLGMGGEFAKEENYAITRAGVEYGYELPKGWEVFGSFSYDMKWNAYDSWGIGLGIAKSFRK